jgi:5-methylcytosine-specific restriction endonuclease McrA
MPSSPKTARPSFRALVPSEANADYEARRRARYVWRSWYGSQRWRRMAKAQLAAEPLCCMCAAEGRVEAAAVADHVTPHRGNWTLFWEGRLQSLCRHHHNSAKQREEAGGP